MAAAAILKNRKIAIHCISAAVQPISPKFGKMMHFNLLTVLAVKNLKFYKSKMAAAAILKIVKWPYLSRDLSDFDEIWHGDAVRPS